MVCFPLLFLKWEKDSFCSANIIERCDPSVPAPSPSPHRWIICLVKFPIMPFPATQSSGPQRPLESPVGAFKFNRCADSILDQLNPSEGPSVSQVRIWKGIFVDRVNPRPDIPGRAVSFLLGMDCSAEWFLCCLA